METLMFIITLSKEIITLNFLKRNESTGQLFTNTV